jgi:hypothetical protein
MRHDDSGRPWVQQLCRAVTRRDELSITDMFEAARPDLDADDFEALVAEQLRSEGGLIDLWETFSADNRGTPASYFVGTEVGYFNGQRLDVRHYADRADACADYIHRRTLEILDDGRLSHG